MTPLCVQVIRFRFSDEAFHTSGRYQAESERRTHNVLCRALSAVQWPLAAGEGEELGFPDDIVFPLTSAQKVDSLEVKLRDDDLEKRVVSTYKYDTYIWTDSLDYHKGPF